MPKYTREKMCRECPFRAASLRGWLGPHTIEYFEDLIARDVGFICHTDVGRKLARDMSEDEIKIEGQHCVGMLRYLNGMLKLSRDPDRAAAQRAIRDVPDAPTIPPREFRDHHTPE